MKRIICLVLLLFLLLGTLIGCVSKQKSEPEGVVPLPSGTPSDGDRSSALQDEQPLGLLGSDAAKLLLAEMRLNAQLLKNKNDIFEQGVEVMRTLSAKALSNLSLTTLQAAPAAKEKVLKLGDKLGDEKQNIGKMEMNGDTVIWSELGEVSNSYEYFLNLTGNIVTSADIAADLIDFVKKNVRVVDKWVLLGQDRLYLHVGENEELLCKYDTVNNTLNVCRRYRDAQGQDVYELYRKNGDYRERMTYIPGQRYELSLGEDQFFVADHSKGYWEAYVLGVTETHNNISYLVMKDDICFDAAYDSASQSANFLKIMSADRETDILHISNYEDGATVMLQLCGFDGVVNVTAPKADAGFGEDYAYVTGSENVKVNTENGSVISVGNSYQDGKVTVVTANVMSYAYGYGAEVLLSIGGTDYEERLAYLKAFLAETGLRCRRDVDKVLSGISTAYLDTQSIVKYYKWNGVCVSTNEGIRRAHAIELARYEEMHGYYTAIKDVEEIDFEDMQKVELNVNFAPIVKGAFEGGRLLGAELTVGSISLTVDDTTLFVKDEPYRIMLALENEGGALIHPEQMASSSTVYAGEKSFSVSGADISLVLPLLAEGSYRVVAYIATSDGIRSSAYIPVAFEQAEQLPVTMENSELSARVEEEGTLTLTYTQKIDVYANLTSTERLTYEAFSVLLNEETFLYGTPTEGSIELLQGEGYVPLTGSEEEIADGSYRIAYTISNGEIKKSGYLYVSYACLPEGEADNVTE